MNYEKKYKNNYKKNHKNLPPFFIALAIILSFASTAAASDRSLPFRDVYPMEADPDTSNFTEEFSPSTLENGRIWIDKSVNADRAAFHDIDGNPALAVYPNPDEFLVTLSAMSQSYSVDVVIEPTDAVFILDVSKSMDVYKLGDLTRAAVMTDALNRAIATLMEANPDNRVAVVSYGGYAQGMANLSRVNRLLPLGRYTVSNGRYFNITGDKISINSEISGQAAGGGTVTVEGATPTQRGVYEGAKILMDNDDIRFDHVTERGKTVAVSRRPAMILLTDGEPTLGWKDYRVEGASRDNGYDSGGGMITGGDLGLDFLTIATASYWKQKVGDHYFGEQSDRAPLFYTIGVGVDTDHAISVMDPASHAGSVTFRHNNVSYNLRDMLDAFVSGERVGFPALNKDSAFVRALIYAENHGGYVKSCDYTDGYFPANDQQALNEAFDSIATRIVSKGRYTTESNPAKPDFSGYLVICDIIGEHMSFRGEKGFVVGGEAVNERHLAMELSKGPASPEWDGYIGALAEQLRVDYGEAEDIVKNSAAGGLLYYRGGSDYSCAFRWYADLDTEFVEPFFNSKGEANPPPETAACVVETHSLDGHALNEVTGEDTDLMHTQLSVITALRPGGFGLRSAPSMFMPLQEGQQMVRWQIPSSLIPIRTVRPVFDGEDLRTGFVEIAETLPIRAYYSVGLEKGFSMADVSPGYRERNAVGDGYWFYSNGWRYDGLLSHNATAAFFQPNRENPYYYFTRDTAVYARPGDDSPAGRYVPGADYYVLNEYFDADEPGYLVQRFERVDQAVSPITAPSNEAPYIPAGSHRKIALGKRAKIGNLTQTYDFARQAETFSGGVIYMLGNNGRMRVGGLTSVTARKSWTSGQERPVWAMLYADGIPAAEPAELNKANGWAHTWDGLLTYAAEADADGNVSPLRYTVAEGLMEDGVFLPYGAENPPEGFEIRYDQPVWDDLTGVWTDAVITNTDDPQGETDSPGETGQPGGTNSPGETGGQPGGTNSPGETGGQPGGTDSPGETGQPGGTNSPGETGGQPGGMNSPGETGGQPGGTNSPGETGTPGATNSPGETGQPGGTNSPGETGGQPGGTNSPGETGGQPGETNSPGGTGTPGGMNFPGETGQPGGTGQSGGTNSPGETGGQPGGMNSPGATGPLGAINPPGGEPGTSSDREPRNANYPGAAGPLPPAASPETRVSQASPSGAVPPGADDRFEIGEEGTPQGIPEGWPTNENPYEPGPEYTEIGEADAPQGAPERTGAEGKPPSDTNGDGAAQKVPNGGAYEIGEDAVPQGEVGAPKDNPLTGERPPVAQPVSRVILTLLCAAAVIAAILARRLKWR